MIEGRINKLDLTHRTALIVDGSGKEYSVKFPERMNVEVIEDETVGTMGGELEDLEEGFEVEVELASRSEDGTYVCDSVVCLS